MGKLKDNEWIMHVPTVPGKTINTHHCKKGKGNDRLYITRNADNSAVAYCHHCGKSGWASAATLAATKGLGITAGYKSDSRRDTRGPIKVEEVNGNPDEWTPESRGWWTSTGLHPDKRGLDFWYVGEQGGRLYFFIKEPVWDTEASKLCLTDDYVKCWSRSTSGKEPKWKFEWGKKGPTLIVPEVSGHSTCCNLVIVEDLMSGVRCVGARTDYAALVLHGTNIPKDFVFMDVCFALNRTRFHNIVTWLDNDRDLVREKAEYIREKSRDFSDDAWKVTLQSEPKHLYDSEIRSLLEGSV